MFQNFLFYQNTLAQGLLHVAQSPADVPPVVAIHEDALGGSAHGTCDGPVSRIAPGHENDFERLWRERDSYLEQVPGFVEFKLLRGPGDEQATLYASHTIWKSEADFRAWTESEHFRKAHAQARAPKGTYLGHPVFEGFESIL